MGYTHAGHIDALNQNIAELADNINVSFEFFRPAVKKWKKHYGAQFIG